MRWFFGCLVSGTHEEFGPPRRDDTTTRAYLLYRTYFGKYDVVYRRKAAGHRVVRMSSARDSGPSHSPSIGYRNDKDSQMMGEMRWLSVNEL